MSGDEDRPKTVFHYMKTPSFRALHVDGAIGSTSPSNHIHLSVYSERPAIPRQVEYELDEAGHVANNGEVLEGKRGYVRELEADLVMSPEVAQALAEWLKSAVEKITKKAAQSSRGRGRRKKKETLQ